MTLNFEETAKKIYQQPALRVFGDLCVITAAGMPGGKVIDGKGAKKTT